MPPKSPEPEKEQAAVGQNVAGFPQIEIDFIKLGRIQGHNPGQQPLKPVPGIGARTEISRHAYDRQAVKNGGKPIMPQERLPPNRYSNAQKLGSFIPVGIALRLYEMP